MKCIQNLIYDGDLGHTPTPRIRDGKKDNTGKGLKLRDGQKVQLIREGFEGRGQKLRAVSYPGGGAPGI